MEIDAQGRSIENVIDVLASEKRKKQMVDNNYHIAAQHYSYAVLCNQLSALLKTFFGDSVGFLSPRSEKRKSEGYLYMDPQMVMYKHFDKKNGRHRLNKQ